MQGRLCHCSLCTTMGWWASSIRTNHHDAITHHPQNGKTGPLIAVASYSVSSIKILRNTGTGANYNSNPLHRTPTKAFYVHTVIPGGLLMHPVDPNVPIILPPPLLRA